MSSDAQPPLTRRQLRERERAVSGEAVTPESADAVASVRSADEGSSSTLFRRRPGSHAAAVAPREAAAPSQPPLAGPMLAGNQADAELRSSAFRANRAEEAARPAVNPAEALPASATEIVPGTGMTRRQLRALRQAQEQSLQPVPLRAPLSQTDDRTVADVLGSVAALHPAAAEPLDAPDVPITPEILEAIVPLDDEPAPDAAAMHQAVAADGAPAAIEPLEEAVAHSEEPRRHRSTWAPPAALDQADDGDAPEQHESQPGAAAADEDVDDVRETVIDEEAAPAPSPVGSRELGGFAEPVATPESVAPSEPIASSDPIASSGPVASPDIDESAADAPGQAAPRGASFGIPAGHWSLQADRDAEIRDTDTGVWRVAEMHTSALILPNTPLSDVTGALNATGEVIITGSIDLPKSLSSTGSHRPIDGAEVDRLLDQQDEIAPTADASPVRASRAVSSHTSTRAVVLAAAKPKESRGPIILAVSAATAAVTAVAAIVVAGFALHFF